ncbi:MAG: alginate lyase family protein [Myxococcota bacterium]|nr:alginate lyase family protein [Myxococcota bacterium]
MSRTAEALLPLPLHDLAATVSRSFEADRQFLSSWGRLPALRSLTPPWRPERHGDPRRGENCFQGLAHSLAGLDDWDDSSLPELWRYHLHYFDVPAAGVITQGLESWAAWLAARLRSHWACWRPGRGVAWKPYPVAVRLQNLLRIWSVLHAEGGGATRPDLDAELARHTRTATLQLAWRLEHHLEGNHLLRELCALALGARAWGMERLFARSMRRLVQQVELQFGENGGHEERSPRYHLDLLRDLVELRLALGEESPGSLDGVIAAGLDFAEALEHPDGDIPLFNDCELDAGPSRATLSACVGHRPQAWTGLRVFEDEGFVVARLGLGHLVFDCGPLAADHQPAHSHCDILSFEYSWGGSRLVGNRGTAAYGQGPERRASRSTAWHSTVQIGQGEQAELWRGFRLGWRGRPVLEGARMDLGRVELVGSFRWHPSVGAEHRRFLQLDESGVLRVEDRVNFSGAVSPVTARFYLPGAEDGRRPKVNLAAEGAEIHDSEAPWFPRLGVSQPGRLARLQAPLGTSVGFVTTITPDR